ncbi:hypothetical protein QP519_01270 [Weeksella virosa]|uniref:hypothetical protein n=1 Tax=Weeksella virosa TaxID=1014 RepID=UPI0025525392|nr:hypothetical protein [Weeksella virosa]MDK7374180.1 hypothetical protein [Weeksella virosa]
MINKKKKFAVGLFFLSSFCMLHAQMQSKQTPKQALSITDFGLIGKVKEIQTKSIEAISKRAATGFFSNEYYNQTIHRFDYNGLLLYKTNFLEYGNRLGIYSEENYHYNQSNQLTEYQKIILNNGEDPRRVEEQKKYYYQNGQLVQEDFVYQSKSNQIRYQTLYTHDKDVQKIVDKIEGIKNSETVLLYNENQNLVKTETTYFNGEKGLVEYFIYDNSSNPIAVERIGKNLHAFGFEDKERRKETRRFYDANWQLEREEVYNNNELIALKKAEKEGQSFLNIYTFDYQYDSHGNWVKCEVFRDARPWQIIERTIAYY